MTDSLAPPKKSKPLLPARAPTPLPAARSRAALGLAVGAAEGRLMLQVCSACGAVQYPPRDVCGHCLSEALQWRAVERGGVVAASSVGRVSSELYSRERQPWRTGVVRLVRGPVVIPHLHG